MRVLIAAGGTGGHVMPALAVAHALRARGDDVLWLGTPAGLEARVVPAAGIALATVGVRALRGKGAARWLAAPWVLGAALLRALRVLARFRPSVVLAMGGFAAGPGGVAAWLCRVPLVVHEQNACPGLTNRLLGFLARCALAGFPDVRLGRRPAEAVGNPVRAELLGLPEPAARGVGKGTMRLLVLGGSQGARALNRLLPEAVALARGEGIELEVRHQAGAGHEAVRADYAARGVPAEVHAFIEDMAASYAWANLVVCRSGALTLAELCAVGIGSVLVPFPHAADDHQRVNARLLERAGAARVHVESGLAAATLAHELGLAADGVERLRRAQAARALARPDATQRVVARLAEHARA